MPIIVNSNIASLNAQRNLSMSNSSLATSLQKLSSGMRVNSAKDDAAGLAVAEGLTSQIRGNNQGIRNAYDGISVAQTAESSLGQVANNLQRVREIAVQAANGGISDDNRAQLQKEVDQLTQEVSRIITTTNFNGQGLLSGGSSLTFQVGASGSTDNQVTTSGADMTAIAGYTADLTATGTVDVSNSAIASASISALDSAISTVTNTRATFGAIQNRFESVIANTQSYVENMSASRSRILDADFAAESANMTKNQVLQQAGTAILSQANQVPQAALSLLK